VIHPKRLTLLQLWVFTDDLNFSSSVRSSERTDPTRAIKALWKPLDRPVDTFMQQNQSSVEELILPPRIFDEVRQALLRSAELLPSSVKQLNGWQVGLLERFDRS
jgi:HECT-like Ubiquitin-conjugating enzyme (E2)-binding